MWWEYPHCFRVGSGLGGLRQRLLCLLLSVPLGVRGSLWTAPSGMPSLFITSLGNAKPLRSVIQPGSAEGMAALATG